MTDEEMLLIRLLRMRTDIGQLGLRRTLCGVYAGDFSVYGQKSTFVASDRLDPVSALIDVLRIPGVALDDLAKFASAQTPRFDIANTPAAVIRRESDYGTPFARSALLEIAAAKTSERFVHEIKAKPVVQPAVTRRKSDLEDLL